MYKYKQLLPTIGLFVALTINFILIVSIHLSWDASMQKYRVGSTLDQKFDADFTNIIGPVDTLTMNNYKYFIRV